MTRYTYETTLSFPHSDYDVEVDVKATFTVAWGHPGCWYQRNGDPGFPPEPDEIDDVKLVSIDGVPVDLCEPDTIVAVMEKLTHDYEELMLAEAAEQRADDRERAEEYRAEARREIA
jgi:hypothetical protein